MDINQLDSSIAGDEFDAPQIPTAEPIHHAASLSICWIAAVSLTRTCLTELILHVDPRFSITTFDSAQHFPTEKQSNFDLVVYHSQATHTINLAELTALTLSLPASTPLIILSDATDLSPDVVAEILKHSISGFLYSRDTSIKILISSLAFGTSGGTFMPRDFFASGSAVKAAPLEEPVERRLLTPRELEVLSLIRQGKPNKLIAHTLNLSASTAKIHVRNVMRKLGATNRTQAAFRSLSYLRNNSDCHTPV
ncbi:response regulator transcription factor [Acidisoma silvae]|nr:response regulator transcription factor [Acidisoma silvae]